jgi:hypothetical protein
LYISSFESIKLILLVSDVSLLDILLFGDLSDITLALFCVNNTSGLINVFELKNEFILSTKSRQKFKCIAWSSPTGTISVPYNNISLACNIG